MHQIRLLEKRATVSLLTGGARQRVYPQGSKPIETLTRALGEQGHTLLPWSLGLAPRGLGLRAVYSRSGRYVFLVECEPGLRTIPWVVTGGDEEERKYRDVQVSVPYTEFFFAVTHTGNLCPSSVYMRTAPVKKADFSDPLDEPHFLNCSVESYGVFCWICSQFMRGCPQKGESLLEYVAACVDYFWQAPFNDSSERHEGQSFFGRGCGTGEKHVRRLPDERVTSLEAWEVASAADPYMALTVRWNPAGRTVADTFQELTGGKGDAWPYRDAQSVANLIVAPEQSA